MKLDSFGDLKVLISTTVTLRYSKICEVAWCNFAKSCMLHTYNKQGEVVVIILCFLLLDMVLHIHRQV